MWNPYWLVSWNSNNHSRSNRAEWIMSWGVAGGLSLWTWSSPRREGDLPWERSGEDSLCPDSAESRNHCRCKPPRAPMSLTQSGYRVYNYEIELCVMIDVYILNCIILFFFSIQLVYPFVYILHVFVFLPLQWSPTVGVSRVEPWWYPSVEQELTFCWVLC